MTHREAQPADLEIVRRSYDAVADNYVSMNMGDLTGSPWLRAVLSAFAEQVRVVGPVLDAGCGPGLTSAYLQQLGVDVRGIDLSPRMIEHARRLNPQIRFDVTSVTDVILPGESLGGVLGWWSWFNLPREVLADVIARMARALRPGGLLLFGTHRGTGALSRTAAYGDVPVEWTTQLYEPEEVAQLLTAAGLEVSVEQQFPPAPPQLGQLVAVGLKPSAEVAAAQRSRLNEPGGPS